MKILIIDDSRLMRKQLREMIAKLGVHEDEVVDAPDGELGWKTLEAFPEVKAVLLDWNMPELNGIELVQKIRHSEKHRKVPIVMVTSEIAKYNIIEAVKAGVNDYVAKPVDESILLEKLRKHLGIPEPKPAQPGTPPG